MAPLLYLTNYVLFSNHVFTHPYLIFTPSIFQCIFYNLHCFYKNVESNNSFATFVVFQIWQALQIPAPSTEFHWNSTGIPMEFNLSNIINYEYR